MSAVRSRPLIREEEHNKAFFFQNWVAMGPAPHRVSRDLGARSPEKVRKESGKSTLEQGPKSAKRVRPGVSKESKKSLKLDFRTLFGLFLRLQGALFRHFWGPAPGYSFRTLFGLFRSSGPKGPGRPCVGRGRSQKLGWFPRARI